MGERSDVAAQVDRGARQSRLLDVAVRTGLLAYGAVHLLIAWVAIRLIFDRSAGTATGQGALAQLAQDPLGRVTLAAMGCAFTALVVWQLITAAVGYGEQVGWRRRFWQASALGRAAVYAWFGWIAARLALHGASSSGRSPQSLTARLLRAPGGPALLVGIGVAIAGIGLGLMVFGLRKGFLPQLEPTARRSARRLPILVLGQLGFALKGFAFVLLGVLVAWAALTNDPSKSGGLDRALYELLGHGLGGAAVIVFGAGIGCFGLYSIARSRHLHRDTMTS